MPFVDNEFFFPCGDVFWTSCLSLTIIAISSCSHPGGNQGANLKSISHRCHPILVEFAWNLTNKNIYLPLDCLQGGMGVARDLGDQLAELDIAVPDTAPAPRNAPQLSHPAALPRG